MSYFISNLDYVTIIIKPTVLCNMKCKHCAVDFKPIIQSSVEFYIKAVETVVNFCFVLSEKVPQTIEIVWHGGEPMLMGKNFYYTVSKALERKFNTIEFEHVLQTNLTLLTKEWKKVIKEVFKGNVSTSYDFYSNFRSYSLSFFLDKIKLLQDITGDRGYVICVLSKENFGRVLDICSIAETHFLNLKLNYLYPVGKGKKLPFFDVGDYLKALEEVVKHRQNFNNIRIDPIDYFSDYKQGVLIEFPCPITSRCVNIFAVMPDGTIWKCAELADMKEPLGFLGTIEKGISIEKFQKFLMFASDVSDECLGCNICFGGCVKQRLLYNSYKKTPFCTVWQKLFNVVN